MDCIKEEDDPTEPPLQSKRSQTLAEVYRQAARYAEHEVYLFEKYAEQREARGLWRWRKYTEVWYCVLRRAPTLMRSPEGRTLLL